MEKALPMKKEKVKRKIHWKRFLPVYLLALPGVIYLIINNYLPMFGVVIAFKDLDFRKGILFSDWAGLQNFQYLFRSSDAWQITRNTVCYNLAFIVLNAVLGIAVAIFLNEVRGKLATRFYQSIMLVPFLISWVVVSYLAYAFLATDTGFINNSILEPLGLHPISWYTEAKYWPAILIFVQVWKSIGFQCVIYYSSLISISTDYYEAATIDGATKWQQIKNITLPLLKPTVITLTILALGRIFNSDFSLFYQVPKNSGMLYSTTRTLDVYVYNALMNNNDYAMSSAASVYQSIVGFICIMLANGAIRKLDRSNALF